MRTRVPFVALLAAVLLGLAGLGLWFHRAESEEVRAEAERNLETIVGLKADQIAGWRRERLGDAQVLRESDGIARDVRRLLTDRAGSPPHRLLAHFGSLKRHYGYADVLLVDREGRIRLSLRQGRGRIHEVARAALAEAFRRRRAVLGDLHAGPGEMPPHIEAIAPVFENDGPASAPVGAILLQSHAAETLYRLIATWPTPSETAETLLVRREGDQVLFLNDLRHRTDTALRLRIPLSQIDLPAARAILGGSGVVDGRDYRGLEVLAAGRRIPDSSWHAVAKIDLAEAMAPVASRIVLITGLFSSLVIAGGLAFVALSLRESKRHYRQLYDTERARADSERQLSAMFELASIGLAQADPHTGRWLRVNQKMCAITGYNAEEMLRLRIPDITHPDDRDADWEAFERVVRGEAPAYQMEKRYRRKDGREIWVNVNVTVIRDAAGRPLHTMAAIEDIAERKRAERALRESEAFTRTVLDNLPIGIAVNSVDPFVGFTYMNDRFARLYRTTRERLTDADAFWEAVYEDPASRAEIRRRVLEDCASGDPERMHWDNVPISRKGEETTYVSARDIPIPGRSLVISTVWDVTAVKRAETELERRVRDRTSELEAANKELEAFAYSVSHDLRAPLRGIDGWSLALLEDCAERLDDEGRGHLNRVRGEAQRMGRLIDALLGLSRIARAEMRPVRVDLSALAEAVVCRLRASEPERQVEVTIEPRLLAQGDRALLEVALTNLLENAWKFSAGRRPGRIELGRAQADGRPAFFVRDNGAGFDPAYAGKLFGAFQRLHRQSEFPGTGVGLATVQRVVRRHGGDIWAEAEVGRGATFYFTLGERA